MVAIKPNSTADVSVLNITVFISGLLDFYVV